ncbi:GIY-YIG nuclease family protein [Sphingomonas sp. DT-207]
MTSDLRAQIVQHREELFDGHTKKHGIKWLAYFEVGGTMESAIVREKQLKRYRREWKRN